MTPSVRGGDTEDLNHRDQVMPAHLAVRHRGSIPANRARKRRADRNNSEEVVILMSDATTVSSGLGRRRWLVLGVIGIAQLMVVLDLTIMNIALPSAQRALHFTAVDRQWVITAYTLSFGSLLLPGGRLADLLGRKVTFLTGLVGFAGVSAIGGASVNFAMLVTARACQGAFAALLVPSALSLLTTTFTAPKDRGKAFGIYGAIAVAGGAVGLLLGGALTQYLSWRWTLYVNLIFAAVAFAGERCCWPASRPGSSPSWTSPACCWSPARCSAWSTGSPTRPRTAGTPPPPTGSSPPAWCSAWRSRPGRAGPPTRCCRPAWYSTATAAALTWPCSSREPVCSAPSSS